jgi:hypothetical protein
MKKPPSSYPNPFSNPGSLGRCSGSARDSKYTFRFYQKLILFSIENFFRFRLNRGGLFIKNFFRVCGLVDIFLKVDCHGIQVERRKTAESGMTFIDAAVIECYPRCTKAFQQGFTGDRHMSVNECLVTYESPVHYALPAPEHGLPVGEGVGDVEIQTGMDENKVVKEEEIRELRKQGNVVGRDFTGIPHPEAVQSLPSPVLYPELEILKGVLGVEKHLFVVAPQSVHRKAFLQEFDDRIEKFPAAWAAVNVIA